MVEDLRLESLSAQERRILEPAQRGTCNREIAAEMFLAEKTVKNYVSNLLADSDSSGAPRPRSSPSASTTGSTRRPRGR